LLIDLLTGNGDSKASALVYPDMTALWEQKMSDIENGGVSLYSFVAEVADMVREILSGNLNVPSDIPGLERRKKFDGEIVEAPCRWAAGRTRGALPASTVFTGNAFVRLMPFSKTLTGLPL
jgi:hypothetical protein